MSDPTPFKGAIVWRGDRQARAAARGETSRLKAVFEALGGQGGHRRGARGLVGGPD